jgi:protein-S-isoprenylcysteine O-methyltransferase Ste14
MIKRTVVTLLSIYIIISYILKELINIGNYKDNIIQFIIFILPYILINSMSCIFLIRSMLKKPKEMNDSNWMVLASFLGTNLTILTGNFIELRTDSPNTALVAAGIIINILVVPFYIAALINLGRSLTILPEANTLKTKGIYSISRHPLYTAYIIWYFTNILMYQSAAIIITSILQTVFQIIRALNEEKILEKNFTEYADYKKRVWWIGRIKAKQLV